MGTTGFQAERVNYLCMSDIGDSEWIFYFFYFDFKGICLNTHQQQAYYTCRERSRTETQVEVPFDHKQQWYCSFQSRQIISHEHT